jgi:hypothetical protein
MVLRCDSPLFWLLPSPPKFFRHRILPSAEFGPPPCPAQFGNRGDRGGGPVHGGGPLLYVEHSRSPNGFNPVNHPFRRGEMTDSGLQTNPLSVVSGLDQTAANGVAHQTCCFVDV